MIKILELFLLLISINFFYNLYYFLFSKLYISKYREYLDDHGDWYITTKRQSIVHLLKRANIEEPFLPIAEPIGYGQLRTGNISVFANLALLREDVCRVVGQCLFEAHGVFWSRMWNSFNPIYWFEGIIFLPKNILAYLGFKAEGLFVKILQLIWWIVGAISTIGGIIFNQDLAIFLFKIIEKFN